MKQQKTKYTMEFVLISVALVCFFVISLGSHNIDNAWNMLKISYIEDADYFYTYCDRNGSGGCVGFSNLYILGQMMVVSASFVLIIDLMIFFWVHLNKMEESKKS